MLRIGLIQMLVRPGEVAANLTRARQLVAEAAAGGARVIVLPEAMDCGWTHVSARAAAGPVPGGTTFVALQNVARDYGVYVCSGLVERSGDRLFNAAVL